MTFELPCAEVVMWWDIRITWEWCPSQYTDIMSTGFRLELCAPFRCQGMSDVSSHQSTTTYVEPVKVKMWVTQYHIMRTCFDMPVEHLSCYANLLWHAWWTFALLNLVTWLCGIMKRMVRLMYLGSCGEAGWRLYRVLLSMLPATTSLCVTPSFLCLSICKA